MKVRIAAFVLVSVLALTFVPSAHAYPKKVERWRPLTKLYLKQHKVYTAYRLDKTLHIIEGESGGSAGCTSGRHEGLVQMTPSWKWWKHIRRRHYKALRAGKGRYLGHRRVKDWRNCGACQLHRMAHVWKHSDAKVRQHWQATW